MNKTDKKIDKLRQVSIVATSCLFAVALVLFALWFVSRVMTVLLICLSVSLSAFVNVVLLFKPKNTVAVQQEKQTMQHKNVFVRFIKSVCNGICRVLKSVLQFCKTKRFAVTAALVLIFEIAVNTGFWFAVKKLVGNHSSGFYLPVALLVLFVILIVVDKWCKHSSLEGGDDYFKAIIHNLRSAIALAKIMLVICAAVVTVCMVGIVDLHRISIWIICLLFVYQTVFILVSLSVRLLRRELDTIPDISVPMLGLGGADLGVITYLEKNTGITMRSLWSIRLIKKIIPYTVLSVVLLLWLSTGIVLVQSNEEGALYRLGKLDTDSLKPGIHFTFPWPIDKVEVYDTKSVNELTVGYLATDSVDNLWTEAHGNNEYKLLVGGGEEVVSINLRVQYVISDLYDYLKNSTAPKSLLESAAYQTVTENTITSDLDTLLAADREVLSETFHDGFENRIEKYNTGLDIVSVVVESIHPPVEIASSYQGIISANIDAEKLLLQAQALAGVTLSEAERAKETAINEATAQNHEKIAAAKSSVAQFMASAQADDAYGSDYRFYKYLEALKKAYSNAKLVIVGDGIDESSIYIGNVTDGKSAQ